MKNKNVPEVENVIESPVAVSTNPNLINVIAVEIARQRRQLEESNLARERDRKDAELKHFDASFAYSNSLDDFKQRIFSDQQNLTGPQFLQKLYDYKGKYGNSCFYSAGINALKNHAGKTYLAFKEINYTFLKQLEGKMLAKGVKVNTVALTFGTRAVF